jgi:hypothetical protein
LSLVSSKLRCTWLLRFVYLPRKSGRSTIALTAHHLEPGRLAARVADVGPAFTRAPVPSLALSGVLRGRLDISRNVDGEAVVLACIDLGEEEGRASAHAVGATLSERFRAPPISGDDVLELRGQPVPEGAVRTLVFSPARLNLYRDAVAYFVARRDQAEWMREEDREPLARVRPLLPALAELSQEALRAALAPVRHGR